MTSGLLQHSCDSKDMLEGIIEQHEVHLTGVAHIVFIETTMEDLQKFCFVCDAFIVLNWRIQFQQITKHDFVFDKNVICVGGLFEVSLHKFNDDIFEPLSVVVIDKSIIENSEGFIYPKFGEQLFTSNAYRFYHAKTLHNFGDISKIEKIM